MATTTPPEVEKSAHRCFARVSDHKTRILILGSMPGARSLQMQQYYAHPQNAFWKIMQLLTHVPWHVDYAQRLLGLTQLGIGLWDVLAKCQRLGSLDANIHLPSVQLNDFNHFFRQHPKLRFIGINGGKAFALFYSHVIKTQGLPHFVNVSQLPSTSPAYAGMPFANKAKIWLQKLTPYLENSL